MKVSNDEAKFNTTKFTSDLLLEHEVANLTVMAADMDERVVLSLLPCTSYNSLRELVCCQLNRNYKVRVKHAYGGLTDDMLIHKLNPKDVVIYRLDQLTGWNELISGDGDHRTELCINELQTGDCLVVRRALEVSLGPRVSLLCDRFINQQALFNNSLGDKFRLLAKQYEYIGMRKVRGDGNCYYRAVLLGLLEQIFVSQNKLAGLARVNEKLREVKFDPVLESSDYEDHQIILQLFELASQGMIWRNWNEFESSVLLPRPCSYWLNAFNLYQTNRFTQDTSDSSQLSVGLGGVDIPLVRACRRIVSQYLLQHQDDQLDNDLSLRDTIFSSADTSIEYDNMESYCRQQVLKLGVDAEGACVELGLLPRSLDCRCTIMVLDRMDSNQLKAIYTGVDTNHKKELEIGECKNLTQESVMQIGHVHILLQPGHYDLLYHSSSPPYVTKSATASALETVPSPVITRSNLVTENSGNEGGKVNEVPETNSQKLDVQKDLSPILNPDVKLDTGFKSIPSSKKNHELFTLITDIEKVLDLPFSDAYSLAREVHSVEEAVQLYFKLNEVKATAGHNDTIPSSQMSEVLSRSSSKGGSDEMKKLSRSVSVNRYGVTNAVKSDVYKSTHEQASSSITKPKHDNIPLTSRLVNNQYPIINHSSYDSPETKFRMEENMKRRANLASKADLLIQAVNAACTREEAYQLLELTNGFVFEAVTLFNNKRKPIIKKSSEPYNDSSLKMVSNAVSVDVRNIGMIDSPDGEVVVSSSAARPSHGYFVSPDQYSKCDAISSVKGRSVSAAPTRNVNSESPVYTTSNDSRIRIDPVGKSYSSSKVGKDRSFLLKPEQVKGMDLIAVKECLVTLGVPSVSHPSSAAECRQLLFSRINSDVVSSKNSITSGSERSHLSQRPKSASGSQLKFSTTPVSPTNEYYSDLTRCRSSQSRSPSAYRSSGLEPFRVYINEQHNTTKRIDLNSLRHTSKS